MATIYQNIKNDRYFKASTKLSIQEFETLYTYFEKLYLSKTSNPYLSSSQQPLFRIKKKLYSLFCII